MSLNTVFVAGAEGHLGQHALRYFSERGWRVAGSCRQATDLQRTQDFVASHSLKNVHLLVGDLGDAKAVESMVDAAESKVGPVDALLNAAGGFRYGALAEADLADYDFLMTANLKSCVLLARALAPRMVQRGRGRMVFVSSRATLGLGEANMSLYLASKAAVNALATSLAAELKESGVTVNAVMPSVIDTPANRTAMPNAPHAAWVTPEALLELVATLFGPAGIPVNGALIPVAGRL